MGKIVNFTKDKYGNNRYENLTQQDRIKLRNCKNTGRRLTPDECQEIFGSSKPKFKRRW